MRLSRSFPIVLLTGARQVGKTTLLDHLGGERGRARRRYVSLDEFELRSLARNDPGLFLQHHPPPLTIDEIQYAPQLLPYLKVRVDRSGRMGEYWLTGSQHFHLMRDVSESLAGRVGVLRLLGLSQAEEDSVPAAARPWSPALARSGQARAAATVRQIFSRIVRGSFPRLVHRNAPPLDAFYGSYVQTYIDRDLRDLVRAGSLSSFERFLRVCAARTASLLNLSDLARDSDVSVNTAKEWLSLLEAAGHVFLLRPYYRNLTKRLTKAPKLYFVDTGLACYLTGWRNADVAARGAAAGALFETYVVAEIIKSYWHRGCEPPIFFFRTKEKVEIDVVLEANGRLLPIEIKLASRVPADSLKGFAALRKTSAAVGCGTVVAAVREPYALSAEVHVLPPAAIS
ncbi:MAG: ATP-binding protein [Deltaproteobacteria bacterium]|nr:ATP-binding protein [Deltaproteobacteria bacterium]